MWVLRIYRKIPANSGHREQKRDGNPGVHECKAMLAWFIPKEMQWALQIAWCSFGLCSVPCTSTVFIAAWRPTETSRLPILWVSCLCCHWLLLRLKTTNKHKVLKPLSWNWPEFPLDSLSWHLKAPCKLPQEENNQQSCPASMPMNSINNWRSRIALRVQ